MRVSYDRIKVNEVVVEMSMVVNGTWLVMRQSLIVRNAPYQLPGCTTKAERSTDHVWELASKRRVEYREIGFHQNQDISQLGKVVWWF